MHRHDDGQVVRVAGLLLAAGVSQRFGSDKRRAPLAGGRTLLAASLALPCAVLPEVLVVLRPGDDPAALAIPPVAHCIPAEQSALGMGHSLASGVQRLIETSQAEAVAIFLGDMPWLGEASLRLLVSQARVSRIVLPVYKGQRGHPVIFGRDFWPDLLELVGDSGAREVIKAHPDAHYTVELDDPGVVDDVDTPQALRQRARG